MNDNEDHHQVSVDKASSQENMVDSISPFVASVNNEDGTSNEVGQVYCVLKIAFFLKNEAFPFIHSLVPCFQVEYEMPLLAPVKDKRVLDVHQMSRDLDGDSNPKSMDFVHMFLTNRHVFT